MDGDDDQLMYIPDDIATSGLLSKYGSKNEYHIINRLRNLLIDLSKEALRDMNISRNQRAKRLLTVLSEVGK
jgi:hypothetical protein